jgi:uncharacterized protein YndB with AHSA1/START domain
MSDRGDLEKAGLGATFERATQAMGEFGVVTAARTVRLERVLPGPIERVWAYLTESDKRQKWLAAGPMDLTIGGRVELTFRNAELAEPFEPPPERHCGSEGGVMRGRVTRCDPPRLLSYTWNDGSERESEVTFELTPQSEEVRLVLTHRRLPDRKGMVGVSSGWHTHLGVLIDHLNGRAPRPFWSTLDRLEAEYERRLPAD